MQLSFVPNKFYIPFGNNAASAYIRSIPQASQIGVQNGAASLYDGFPPLNFLPVSAGGVPPYGQDVNGILYQISAWSQWYSAGGAIQFDQAFATSVGYPKGAIVGSKVVLGNQFMSVADNNPNDPDAGGPGWTKAPGTFGTGDVMWTMFDDIPTGWVPARQFYTIGSVNAPASYAANDALPLYRKIWNKFSQAQCPVTGGRGVNADTDFANGKQIAVPSMSGISPIGADWGSGLLNGVPVISGSANTNGSIIGENVRTTDQTELPNVTLNVGTSGTVSGTTSGTVTGSTSGTVNGSTSGTVTGTTSGDVSGSVSGSVSGTVSGNINVNTVNGDVASGTISTITTGGGQFTYQGFVAGTGLAGTRASSGSNSMSGSMSGTLPGTMSGTLSGSMSGTFPGSMTGTFPGSMTGTFPGTMSGTMSGVTSALGSGASHNNTSRSMVGTYLLKL